jgi:hypothetical protein
MNKSSGKIKLVYFTVVDLGNSNINGGSLCCCNHIKRLNADMGIELFVLVAGDKDHKTNTQSFLDKHGIASKFITWQNHPPETQMTFFQKRLPIPWEEFVHQQPCVDQAIVDTLALKKADILLIDFYYSAMFCPRAIKAAPKTALINLNRETEFYWEILKKTNINSRFKLVKKVLTLIRFWLVEKAIFRSVNKIIALSPPDVPRRKGLYITPYLDMKTQQWKPNSARTVFFVGNIGHYPNREAIEYIVTKLAPAVIAIAPDVRFKIIGASPADVSFSHPSVDLLGKSDSQEVERQFLNCQLFICPVKNTFGLKFKMAEALSYGTPFLASPESMQCVPHLKNLPSMPLEDPVQAARHLVASICDKTSTINLAASISSQHLQFIASQKNIWGSVLSQQP